MVVVVVLFEIFPTFRFVLAKHTGRRRIRPSSGSWPEGSTASFTENKIQADSTGRFGEEKADSNAFEYLLFD